MYYNVCPLFATIEVSTVKKECKVNNSTKFLMVDSNFLFYFALLFVVHLTMSCESGGSKNDQLEQKMQVAFMSEHESRNFLPRDELLKKLKEEPFDVLIIGGGATGAGAALDAASRGLKTALIEAYDFSSGTSSRSTKLIHGGVRYLENAVKKLDRQEYELVRDALIERKNFLANAPHLTRPLAILTPVYGWFEALYYLIGLKLYDFIAGDATLGNSEFLSKEVALSRFPMMKKESLKGAVVYFDGQFDDARMNVTLILTAIKQGAVALNYVRALGLLKENDKVIGVEVRDDVSHETFKVSAKTIINATGTYADAVRHMDDAKAENIMIPSQGSHLILNEKFSPPDTGMIIPKTKDGRVLFVLPWSGKTIVGTTDQPEKISDLPKASNDEVEYMLAHLREYYGAPIKRSDIIATWSGLRPLAKPKASTLSTASISRDHLIEVSKSNLITIVGGKWTTYRKMAEDVINTAISVGFLKPVNQSVTKNLKLLGAQFYKENLAQELTVYENLPPDIATHLASSYGDRVDALIDIDNKSRRNRLIEGFPFIEAEVIYALTDEYAIHAMDIIARRMRLAFLDNKAAKEVLPKVVAIMAEKLLWDQSRKEHEMELGYTFLDTMFTKTP
jgi:glycerol-3-phosphate dehydrogenase